MEDSQEELELDRIQFERVFVPLRRDLRDYAACWARVLSFLIPGLGHVFIGSTGFGLLYVTMSIAAGSMLVLNRDSTWWPGAIFLVIVWVVSLGHIHAQTRDD